MNNNMSRRYGALIFSVGSFIGAWPVGAQDAEDIDMARPTDGYSSMPIERTQIQGVVRDAKAAKLFDAADAALHARRYDEAEKLYLEVLQILTGRSGEDTAQAASTYNLAVSLMQQRQLNDAEVRFREACALFEPIYGLDSPLVAQCIADIGEILRLKGKPDEAESLLRRALRIQELQLGPEHLDVASTKSTLGAVLSDREQFAQAEPLFRDALAVRLGKFPANDPHIALSRHNLGSVLLRQRAPPHKLKEAEASSDECIRNLGGRSCP